jgi:hypothetical protein
VNRPMSSRNRTGSAPCRCIWTWTMALAALAVAGALLPSTTQAAVPDAAPASHDDSLYPRCDELIPTRLREKYLKGLSSLPLDMYSRDTPCDFSKGPESVSVSYRCRKNTVFSGRKLDSAKETEIRGLGRFAYRSADSKGPFLNFIDDDTPCTIGVFVTRAFGVDAMVAFARDLAASATPEAVSRETIDGLVSFPAPADSSAEDAADTWEKERVAVTSILKLDAGFPQKVELLPIMTGDPQRTGFVLGYCARRQFDENYLTGLKKLLPGLTVERFPAEGHPASCPTAVVSLQFSRTLATEAAAGKLAVIFGLPRDPPFRDSLLLVAWRDSANRLLDWKRIDVLKEARDAKKMLDPDRPERDQTRACDTSVKPDGEGALAMIECPLSPDPEFNNVTCKENPMWRLSWKITGKGDKLSIQRKRIVTKGRGCFDDH